MAAKETFNKEEDCKDIYKTTTTTTTTGTTAPSAEDIQKEKVEKA